MPVRVPQRALQGEGRKALLGLQGLRAAPLEGAAEVAGRFTDFADALKRVYPRGAFDKFINPNSDPRGELIAMSAKMRATGKLDWVDADPEIRLPKTTEEALVERAVLKLADENNWKTYVWTATGRPNIQRSQHHKGVVWWAAFEVRGRKMERLLRFGFRIRNGEICFEALTPLESIEPL